MKVGTMKSEKELPEEVEKRAHKYAKEYHCCSQYTLLTIQEMFGLINMFSHGKVIARRP